MPDEICSAREYARLVQEAREANTKVLTNLTRLMLEQDALAAKRGDPAAESHLWKGFDPAEKGASLRSLRHLNRYKKTSWHPLIAKGIRFAKILFPDAQVVWASVSLEEKSKDDKQTLGLNSTVILFGSQWVRDFTFAHSITRHLIEHRKKLGGLKGLKPEGIGICATKEPLLPKATEAKELRFLHVQDRQFVTSNDDDPYAEAVKLFSTEVSGSWTEYVRAYQPLVAPTLKVATNISATSFYNAVADPFDVERNGHSESAVQLVFGLNYCPRNAASVVAFYQLLQVLQCGIPPLYSSLHVTARELRRLRTQGQRMVLLEPPLTGLSEALARLQTEAQELSAILYEPTRSLFHSHRLLAELFTERNRVQLAKKVTVEVRHNLIYEDKDMLEGRVIVAAALCRIFGGKEALTVAAGYEDFLVRAEKVLDEIEHRKEHPFAEHCNHLKWLCRVDAGAPLSQALKLPPFEVLTRLKQAFFDPYKLHAAEWPTLPFVLATRPYLSSKAVAQADPAPTISLGNHANPTTCQHVIELIMGVAVATRSPNRILGSDFTSDPTPQIRIRFDCKLVRFVSGAANLAQEIRRYVLATPREWRIQHEMAGNWRKPFIDFSARLLGVDRFWEATSGTINAESGTFELICLRHKYGPGTFTVVIEQDDNHSDLIIRWSASGTPVSDRKATNRPTAAGNASPDVYLLDHLFSGTSDWAQKMVSIDIVRRENVRGELSPAVFLTEVANQDCRVIFLHSRDPRNRANWITAVREKRYRGHLVLISLGAPEEVVKYAPKPKHPRIHPCEYGVDDFTDQLLPFFRALRNKRAKLDGSILLKPEPTEVPASARRKDIVVLGANSPIRSAIASIAGRQLTDKDMQRNGCSQGGWIKHVGTIVLVLAKGEHPRVLDRRHMRMRSWLRHYWRIQAGKPLFRWAIWVHNRTSLENHVIADNGSPLTYPRLERDGFGFRIFDSKDDINAVISAVGAESPDWEAQSLEGLDGYFSSDILTRAMHGLTVALGREDRFDWDKTRQHVAKIMASLAGANRYRLDAFFAHPSHEHAKHFIARLQEVETVTTADTQPLVKALRHRLKHYQPPVKFAP